MLPSLQPGRVKSQIFAQHPSAASSEQLIRCLRTRMSAIKAILHFNYWHFYENHQRLDLSTHFASIECAHPAFCLFFHFCCFLSFKIHVFRLIPSNSFHEIILVESIFTVVFSLAFIQAGNYWLRHYTNSIPILMSSTDFFKCRKIAETRTMSGPIKYNLNVIDFMTMWKWFVSLVRSQTNTSNFSDFQFKNSVWNG